MTILCALSQSSLPAHHSAASAGARSGGGFALPRERLNSGKSIASPAEINRKLSPPPFRREPPCRLFDDMSEREQCLLVEGAADELEPEREALRGQTPRDGKSGQPRHVHRHREYVVEIHLDRVGSPLLADAERGRGRGGGENRIDTSREDGLEIALDQRAHLLRPQIVGVVIAGGEHI